MPSTHAAAIGHRHSRRPPMELMLRNLPAHQREIIVATYLRRRTTREAATLLGLTPETVKARVYQAMRHLSTMVATDWPNDAEPYTADRARSG